MNFPLHFLLKLRMHLLTVLVNTGELHSQDCKLGLCVLLCTPVFVLALAVLGWDAA